MERMTRRNTHIRDDPMERTSCVSKTVLSRSELTEILRCTRNHVIVQAEDDSASRFRVDRDVELYEKNGVVIRKFRKVCSLKHYGAHEYIRPVTG
jgi:hypothetical protein